MTSVLNRAPDAAPKRRGGGGLPARLEVIMLSLLLADERTGYDVLKWIERNGAFAGYRTQASQIYRQFTRMQAEGWVESTVQTRDRGPDANVYRITPSGEVALEAWIDSPYEPSPRPLDPDFQVRLMFSARRGPAKALELVRIELEYRRRNEDYRKGVDLDLLPRGLSLEQQQWHADFTMLSSERGHYMAQTLIAWLESAEVRLRSMTERM